ncbi:hypothetical protein AJ79_07023 [Helicocarpus griseus UAMH5409]|uniref:Zn(2)-C6 fungal-type domain-containing protein n=1 Tax=Helicocarpus griseus UAMH5409 TaxID=1447875 RepID=A0A2B7X6D1_9EURO|nr:hypothetical protein AJ79_07023 [Helicocarpus griseus UAMH5409]
MDPEGYFGPYLADGGYPYHDIPPDEDERKDHQQQTSMNVYGNDCFLELRGSQSTGRQNYGSGVPIHLNNAYCYGLPPTKRPSELRPTETRLGGRYWEMASSSASTAPNLWTEPSSRPTCPSTSQTSELDQGIYDSQKNMMATTDPVENQDHNVSRPSNMDDDLLCTTGGVLGDDTDRLVDDHLIQTSFTQLPMGNHSQPNPPPWPEYSVYGYGVPVGQRDDNNQASSIISTGDALVGYGSQLHFGSSEQQDAVVVNNTYRNLTVLGEPLECEGQQSLQPPAAVYDTSGDKQRGSKQKSCWFCRFKKGKCTGGTPCDGCKTIMKRKGAYLYKAPCFRNHLEAFSGLLFPATLRRRIWPRTWAEDYKNGYPENRFNNSFMIPLTAGFGKPIQVLGIVSAVQREDIEPSRRLKTDETTREPTVFSEKVLPILPACRQSKELVYQISYWVDDVARSQNLATLSSWVTAAEKNDILSTASGSVLRAVCRYYGECDVRSALSGLPEPFVEVDWRGVRPNDTLRHAMKVAILAIVMSTCMRIHTDGFQQLRHAFPTAGPGLHKRWMIPRPVNKLLKYAVCRNLMALTKVVLIGLDKLLNLKRTEIPVGHVTCIVTLLASAISAAQVSLADVCIMTQGDEETVPYREASEEISKISYEFDKITCLFHGGCKIKSISTKQQYQKLDDKTKDLVDDIADIIPALRENTSHIRGLDFGNMDLREVADLNTDRVFCALLNLMLGDSTRTRRRRG